MSFLEPNLMLYFQSLTDVGEEKSATPAILAFHST